MHKVWSWWVGGIALGLSFLLAVALVKPIGVSTQFVIVDAILWDSVDDNLVYASADSKSGFASSNAYLNKSGGKYAKNVAKPLNYSLIFVISIGFGALLSRLLGGPAPRGVEHTLPDIWRANRGGNPLTRYLAVFVGGALVLFGARMAGGCTSGHMMSGMMQTSVSAYLFALGAFAAAIPLSLALYRRDH